MMKTLVFTDMDGTLLDHHTYSFEAAKPALKSVRRKRHPGCSNNEQNVCRASATKGKHWFRWPIHH